MSNSEWINNVASINVSKDGKKLYMKVNKDVSLKAGDTLKMDSLNDVLDGLVQHGRITPEEKEARLERQHFVKYQLSKGPSRD